MATPANSPCAPAIGLSATPCMPVTSFSISCSSYMQARNPWPCASGASGWRARNCGSMRVLIAGLGVVLHRARAERIEVRVDGEVQLRQPREVAHRLELADLRQRGRRGAPQVRRQVARVLRHPPRPATDRSRRAPGCEYSKITFSLAVMRCQPRLGGRASGGARRLHHLAQACAVTLDVGRRLGLGGAHQQRMAELRVVRGQIQSADDAPGAASALSTGATGRSSCSTASWK